MSFIAFKVSDYNHTAEREQYRAICNILRSKYDHSDELCVFIANYNMYDCEFDGILIKSDAIIAIEFKNYGGNISAVENGEWSLSDGTIIKGGSRKSVYQQAKINHVSLKRGLKEGNILPPKSIKEVPSLIVFAQPIVLYNQLSERVKSWLHICDTDHFIDKIEDITNPNLDLSTSDIIELFPKLGLLDEFIDSRFSVDINIIDKDHDKDVPNSNVESPSLNEKNDRTEQIRKVPATDNDIKSGYQDYIENVILPSIGLKNGTSVRTVYFSDFEQIIGTKLPFKSEFVVILQVANAETYIRTLHAFLNKDVIALTKDTLVWGEGEFYFEENSRTNKDDHSRKETISIRPTSINPIIADSNSIKLPKWLDYLIYSEFEGKYQPSYERFSYNLDLNKSESKIYLGTYFPRSFAESYMIINEILKCEDILNNIRAKSTIKLLDFGCGAGGEFFGFLSALQNHGLTGFNIKIVGIDGNHYSLRFLERITEKYNSLNLNNVELSIAPCFIESQRDLEDISQIIGSKYDFIITSKAIGEFESKKRLTNNAYEFFASLFAPLLSELGLMLILDVTTKDHTSGLFLPQLMNLGINSFLSTHSNSYKSLSPCSGMSDNSFCSQKCFFKKEIFVSHSAKSKDISKFAFRIICRKELELSNNAALMRLNNDDCVFKN